MNEPIESATPPGHVGSLIVDLGRNSAVTRNRAYHELVSLRKAAVEPLISALCTSTEYGRGQAAKALGEIGDPTSAPALVKALEDDKFDVRWLAALAIVALGRAGLSALLQALIERPHSTFLRESAHHVLHDETDENWSRQLEPVMQALEGPDPESALPMAGTNALRAIRNQTDKTHDRSHGRNTMNHKLLFAVDGTKNSLQTADYVAELCAGSETKVESIIVFHVLPGLPPHIEGSNAAAADNRAEVFSEIAWDKAEQTLAQIKARIVRGRVTAESVTTEAADEEGDVVAQIIQAAAAHGCDTIVVGRHEKSLFGRFLGGSVGEQLLRKANGYAIWLVE